MKNKNIYYVYIYCDTSKPISFERFIYSDTSNPMKPLYLNLPIEPFYIGKGKGRRALDHYKEALKDTSKDPNKEKLNLIKKILEKGIQPFVSFLDYNLSNEEANRLEKYYIKLIGRKDLGTGPLLNRTDGGDGGDTWEGISFKEREQRFINLSKAMKGIGGKYERTEEIKEKIRKSVYYYYDNFDKEDHSQKTKKGMKEKGITSEEISKRTKEGMLDPKVRAKCAFWKGKIKVNDGKTVLGIFPEELDYYLNLGWKRGLIK